MQLGNKEIELRTPYKVQEGAPGSATIDYDVLMYEVLEPVLYYKIAYPYARSIKEMLSVIGTELERRTFIWNMEEYTGDLLYRVRKYLELQGVRLDAYDKDSLAHRLRSYTQQRITNMDIVFDNTIDWDSGEFHENEGSCWWDDRYAAGKLCYINHIQNGGGFVMKFFEEGQPSGRAFALFHEEGFVVFNLYVRPGVSGEDALNILDRFLGMRHTGVGLTVRGDSDPYINGNSGYYFYKKQRKDRISILLDDYDFNNPEIEVLRYSRRRYPQQMQCPSCHRMHPRYMDIQFVKPYNRMFCAYCIGGISTIGPLTKDGQRVYYDRAYYKYSKNDRNKIVRIAGKVYEQG